MIDESHNEAGPRQTLDDFVGFQYTITNVGVTQIRNVYIGFFADSDIGLRSLGSVASDDMAGSYSGAIKASDGSSIAEGIGQGRVTGNVDGTPVDIPLQVSDADGVAVIFDLLKDEGLCLGGSSGINVAGAIKLAKELGPGHTIVTMLCDFGTRYQSKLFNPAFLKEKGLEDVLKE